MKRSTQAAGTIATNNTERLSKLKDTSDERVAILSFIKLLAEMSDAIGAGEQVYMTIGANRQRTALIMTLNDGASKSYAGGQDLFAAMDEAARTL